MDIAIVIVNYATAALAVDCLHSLAADPSRTDGWRVIVVDNASHDDSASVLEGAIAENQWSDWVHLLPATQNSGFAGGNNLALAEILPGPRRPDHLLLLNPDTVVRAGAIPALVRFLTAHPQVGIAGSRLEGPDGTLQTSAFNFPSVLQELTVSARLRVLTLLLWRWRDAPSPRDEAHRCDWVAGACMLVRREVFEQVGLLDDGYFMYYEEVDFCLRAARAGWECWYVPEARVVHLAGRSSGVTDTRYSPRRLPAYWFESRRRYFEKNHGKIYRIMADVAWTLGQAIYSVYRLVRGRPDDAPPFMVRDFLSHSLGKKTAP